MTKEAASEARNMTGPAISSGRPQRPNGVRWMMVSDRAGSSRRRCVNVVAIHPGATAFHADTIGRPRHCQRLCELHNSAFTGTVAGSARGAEKAVHGGEIHDRAAGLQELGMCRQATAHGSRKVHVDHLFKCLEVEFFFPSNHASGIHEYVKFGDAGEQIRDRR